MKVRWLDLCLFACLFLVACSTAPVTPDPVESHSIAPDGNQFDAGIVGRHFDTSGKFDGWEVRQYWVDTYAQRIAKYGDRMKPEAVTDPAQGIVKFPNGNYLITVQVRGYNLQAARMERSGVEPTPGWEKLLHKVGL